jgi:hypothetical protein
MPNGPKRFFASKSQARYRRCFHWVLILNGLNGASRLNVLNDLNNTQWAASDMPDNLAGSVDSRGASGLSLEVAFQPRK